MLRVAPRLFVGAKRIPTLGAIWDEQSLSEPKEILKELESSREKLDKMLGEIKRQV